METDGLTSAELTLKLRNAHLRVATNMTALQRSKANLLAQVGAAKAAGWSLPAIAAALGVSKSRAQQLVRQADGRGRQR